ncbi:MAG: hypothetical protein GPJ54_19165 [Candidatus Heimdallarchaeota archaeon]|nr:hypothetical protein [Candidatus Heimdallarchaeota archaeon]
MLSGYKLKLSGKGILIPESQEWLDDNIKVISQGEIFYEVIDISDENQELKFGWFIDGNLKITSDFTLHTKNGMRGESFTDDLKQTLIIDQYSKLAEFTAGELIDLDITEYQSKFDTFLGSNYKFEKRYKEMHDKNENGVIFLSQNPEMIQVQSNTNSVRISNQGIFVLDREEETLVLISDEYGITVIQDGKSVVEVNEDKGIRIDGREFDPLSIVNHVAESISEAFSDLDF